MNHRRRPARESYGPGVERIGEARKVIEEKTRPEEPPAEGIATPPVWTLRTLARAETPPFVCGDVTVTDYGITAGQPLHGEMRSDDHIGSYTAIISGVECPTCGHDTVEFDYEAYHFIAGSFAVRCRNCDHELKAESWD